MENNYKYFVYVRKSTDDDRRQILSIDAQKAELRQLSERQGLVIVDEIEEKLTATKPGRPQFNKMLDRIAAGEAQGIIAWHPNRLARNPIDAGRIIYLLDVGTIKSLKFHRTWFENTPQGKHMLHTEFGQSKYYVDSMSEDTKRGIREKIRRGERPGRAPIGYLNDLRKKRIFVDRTRAPLIKWAFTQYAAEACSLDMIRDYFSEHGARAKTGKLLGRQVVSRMLVNPVYYGCFQYDNVVHQGIHEPIISKVLFDQVQKVLQSRWRWSPKVKKPIPKAFSSLLSCPDCGGAITAEIQKGHTYYRCTKKNRFLKCTQPYIREESLAAQLSELLKPYCLSEEQGDDLLAIINAEKNEAERMLTARVAAKRAEIEKVNVRFRRLRDLMLDGIIEQDAFRADKAVMMSEKKQLEEQLSLIYRSQKHWLEPLKRWIIEAKHAGQIASTGSYPDRKSLAKKVFGSNLLLDGRKARGDAVKPWSLLAHPGGNTGLVCVLDAARSFFQGQPAF